MQSRQRVVNVMQQQKRRSKTAAAQYAVLDETFEGSLQTLTVLYKSHGFASRMPQVHATLTSIQPFIAAITSMVSAHPEVAGIIWGLVQMVYQVCTGMHAQAILINSPHQSAMLYTSIFDTINDMLQDLSNALPRFQAYVEVIHTPRLHEALRRVYEKYIDFCLATVKFLNLKFLCESLAIELSLVF